MFGAAKDIHFIRGVRMWSVCDRVGHWANILLPHCLKHLDGLLLVYHQYSVLSQGNKRQCVLQKHIKMRVWHWGFTIRIYTRFCIIQEKHVWHLRKLLHGLYFTKWIRRPVNDESVFTKWNLAVYVEEIHDMNSECSIDGSSENKAKKYT